MEHRVLDSDRAGGSLGHVYARSGRVEEGVSWLQQASAGYASAEIGYLRSMSMVQLGEAHLLAGRVEGASESAPVP